MAITEKYANFNLATGLNDGSSEANAWQTPGAITFAAGERVNLKCTTRATLASDWLITANGTATQPILIRGYTSTIGDGGKALVDQTVSITGSYVVAGNLDIEVSGTGDKALVVSADGVGVYNIKAVNTATGAYTVPVIDATGSSIYNCYFEGRGNGVIPVIDASRVPMDGIVIKATNGQRGMTYTAAFRPVVMTRILAYAPSSATNDGINIDNLGSQVGSILSGFTINNFTEGLVLEQVPTATDTMLISNGVISNATNAINTDEATDVTGVNLHNIAFYNNTTDSNLGDNVIHGQIDCTVDPYTDAANADFSPNNTAGGGALLRSAASIGAGDF